MKWISIKDQSPEIGISVVVITKKSDEYKVTLAEYLPDKKTNESYWQFSDCGYDFYMDNDVYYWMQLPSLPKELNEVD